MKSFLTLLLLILASFLTTTIIQARCGDTWTTGVETSSGGSCASQFSSTPGSLTKTLSYAHVYWLDGYQRDDVVVSDTGQTGRNGILLSCTKCWPKFRVALF